MATRIRFTLYGCALGAIFPAAAFLLESRLSGAPLLRVILSHPDPLLFVSDAVPLLFGALTYFLGGREEHLRKYHHAGLDLEQAERVGKYGSWEMNPKTQELRWSQGFYHLLGLDPSVPASLATYRRVVHPDDLASYNKQLSAFLAQGTGDLDIRVRIVTPAGEIKWIRGKGAFVRGAEPDDLRLLGTSHDVTELVQAEMEARSYKQALDQSAIVAIADGHGKIIYANREYSRVSGFSNEELVGQEHHTLKSGVMSEGFFAEMWSIISSGKTWRGEICDRAKDGRLYWVDTTIVPTVEENGSVSSYTAIRYEITERKKLENELWASHQLQRAILDGVGYAVIGSNREGLIHTFNRAAEELLGYSANEVIGVGNPAMFHDPVEIAARSQALAKELGRHVEPGFDTFVVKASLGKVDQNEWTYVRKDGSRLPANLSVSALRDQWGGLIGFVGIAQDVTEAKRVTDALIAAHNKAAEASRVKSEFLANMSHEIRTPMNGVIGMCELLLDSATDPLQIQRLRTIRESGAALLKLINDILDFSKIEAGKLELEQTPFEPDRVIRDVVALLDPVARRKGLSIGYEPSPEFTRGAVLGDPVRFRQIVTNLVGNALKFTEQGGVRVTAARGERPNELRFSVVDTGIGMSSKSIEKLFASFVQVDASTTRKFGGTGLGLAISKALCEQMGGKIGVESREGQGSTFSFSIFAPEAQAPARVTEVNSIKETADGLAQRFPLRILLAEDNETNRLVMLGMLKRLGYEADTAHNGREAIDAVERGTYDLILMDCHMPDVDGYEATRQIRKLRGTQTPRIVAVTANAFAEDVQRCKVAGMDDFVSKPVSLANLIRAIQATVPGQPPAQPQPLVQAQAQAQPQPRQEPTPAPAPASEAPLFDEAGFLLNFAGMEDLALDAIDSIFKTVPGLLEKGDKAIAAADAKGLEVAAHTLKGSLATFRAGPACAVAADLERRAKAGELGEVAALHASLKKEVSRLFEALKRFAEGKRSKVA